MQETSKSHHDRCRLQTPPGPVHQGKKLIVRTTAASALATSGHRNRR